MNAINSALHLMNAIIFIPTNLTNRHFVAEAMKIQEVQLFLVLNPKVVPKSNFICLLG